MVRRVAGLFIFVLILLNFGSAQNEHSFVNLPAFDSGSGHRYNQDLLASLRMKFEVYELENGLQVLLQPDPSVEEVSVEFWLRSGIRNEQSDKYGLAHFFEHVTPYGLRDNKEERELFNSMRTGSNAQVRKDFIRYNIHVKPEGLDLALKYTADRIGAKSSDIDDASVVRQRARVLSEIERNSANPFWSAEGGGVLSAATFGISHPYGHSGYGTIENNKNFHLGDFRAWFQKHVFPGNVILFVVGNYDEKTIKTHIESYFGAIPKRDPAPEQFSVPGAKQMGRHFAVQTKAEHNYLIMSWAVSGWGSPEDAVLRILAQVLDRRLADSAKREETLIKTSSTDLLGMYQYAGQFGVYGSFLDLKDEKKIRKILEDEMKRLVENGITDAELEDAKRKEIETVNEMKENLGFQYSRTELLGEGLLFRNDADSYFRRLQRQENVTGSDVVQVAKALLKQKPSAVLFKSKQ